MSEQEPEVQAGPVVKVARDLTEILAMTAALDDQAEHKANARIDGTGLPGGLAMVALAHVANLEAWEAQYEAWEHFGRPRDHVEDEDDAWEPPLQTLCFWSEQWRAQHGAEYDMRPTVASEAAFIRWALDWAWDNEPHWDDFANDVRKARVRMENVLYAGKRPERTRIVCDQCEEAPQLLKLPGIAEDGSDDRWKCPGCKHKFDQDGLRRAHGRQLRHEAAARFVDQGDAIATLRAQGRPERTVRKWLAPLSPLDECEECDERWPHQEFPACPRKDARGNECGGLLRTVWRGDREALVEGYCELGTRKRFVWWPDLWRRHLSTPTRNREESA